MNEHDKIAPHGGIPGDQEWLSRPWGLDERWAHNVFFGKDLQEAERLFEENALSRQEDLNAMPFEVFRYYVWAFINYMLGDSCRGDADGANGFLSLVEFRRDDLLSMGCPVLDAVRSVLLRIENGQLWFDAQEDIDGNYKEKVSRIDKRIFANRQ